MDKMTFIIADDHPTFSNGLRQQLECEADFECVGIAPDGIQAIRLAKRLRPDIA